MDDDKEKHDARVQIVAPRKTVRMLDEWRRKQPDLPNRSEAIRRMIERTVTEGAA